MSFTIVYKTGYVQLGIREANIIHSALLELEKHNPYPPTPTEEERQKKYHDEREVFFEALPALARDFGVISKALESWRLNIGEGKSTYPDQLKKDVRVTIGDCIIINDALKNIVKKNPYKPIEPNLSDPNPTIYQHHIPELYGKFKIIKDAMMSKMITRIHFEP